MSGIQQQWTKQALCALRRAILTWHDDNARDLPWRGERDPYRIYVSEIMLQQTRTEAVAGYYRAFLEAFEDVFALSRAELAQVLKRWEGLGYYSRARSMHRAAKVVADELGGAFPRDVKGLRALPGVGEYTAGAIASMAFGLAEPSVDGNQVRVLARLFDVRELTSLAATKRQIRALALSLIDRDRPGDFNQALMGLGAMVCLPRKPHCENCPARGMCRAFAQGVQRDIPLLPRPPQKKVEARAVALVVRDGHVLVVRRAEDALLGGLWEFPNFLDARGDDAVRAALCEMDVAVRAHRLGARSRHVFTHLIWEMQGHIYQAAPGAKGLFVDAGALKELAMPVAMRAYRAEALSLLEGK